MRHVLTSRGSAFVSAGAVLAVGGVAVGLRDLTRLGILLLALALGSVFLTRRHGLAFAIERDVRPSRVTVDEAAVVQVGLRNLEARRAPVLLAEERTDYALGDRPRFVVPTMGPREHHDVEYTVRAHTRGEHVLGPLSVRVRDPFGLTTRLTTVGGVGTVLVLPRIHDLASGRHLGRGVGAEGSVPHRVALHGEDDQAIREYRDGDDLRRIHWPATARTGELMVRQEDRPAKRRALLLLDRREEAHGGTGRTGSLEWAVSMTASVAHHLAGLGYAVHLLTDDPTADAGIREDTDPDDALETLARVGTGRPEGLHALLHGAHLLSSGGGVIVLVGGPMHPDDVVAVSGLRTAGATGLAFVVDPTAFGRGAVARPEAADQTVAALVSSGWSATTVAAGTGPAEAWSGVAGARHEVLR